MAGKGPVFHQVNLVAHDPAASLGFYRRLGLDVPADNSGDWDGYLHIEIPFAGGVSLEIDNQALAAIYNAGRRSPEGGPAAVLGFAVDSREAVDSLYAALLTEGGAAIQPPYDAFWGARYAIVADPDGNAVGLMSPRDRQRSSWPPVASPSP